MRRNAQGKKWNVEINTTAEYIKSLWESEGDVIQPPTALFDKVYILFEQAAIGYFWRRSFLSFPAEIYTAFIFSDKMHVITSTYVHIHMYAHM